MLQYYCNQKQEEKNMNGRELDVLSILLKSDEALMAADIVNIGGSPSGLTQSTVTYVLRKLLHLGYIEVTGVTQSGKVLSRLYRPTDLSRKAILQHFSQTYAPFMKTLGLAPLVTEILSSVDEDKRKALLEELKEML